MAIYGRHSTSGLNVIRKLTALAERPPFASSFLLSFSSFFFSFPPSLLVVPSPRNWQDRQVHRCTTINELEGEYDNWMRYDNALPRRGLNYELTS